MYKTSDLAKRLKLHPNTIRNHADEFARWMSPTAIAAKRSFTQDDALVLATIAHLRNQGLKNDLVKEQLAAGFRVDTLPPGSTPEEDTARESIALVALPEYTRVSDQLRQKEAELGRVLGERDKAVEDREQANRRISDLQLEIGRLQGRLEALEQERRPAEFWVRVLILAIVGMMVITLLAVILLSSRGV